MLRVALLGIYHESNTFIEGYTTINDFQNSHWLTGSAIRSEYVNAHHEIGGMIEVLEANQIEIVPVMFAEAVPGGRLSRDTYEELQRQTMISLEHCLPVDGCLVALHGAAVAEHIRDMDGDWLNLLRVKFGNEIPIIGTLDPHANCSDKMIHSTDALIAYHTNPHIDQRDTGKKAASLMVRRLTESIKPVQKKTDFPLAISIEQQDTSQEPCLGLFEYAAALSGRAGVLSVSVLLGFPYADVEEMGSCVVVVTDENEELAGQIGQLLREFLIHRLQSFNGNKTSIGEIFGHLQYLPKPVLLLDMGDNIGGGSIGNSAYLLDELEYRNAPRFFICLYDPVTISQLLDKCPGDHYSGRIGDSAVYRLVTVTRFSDGKFRELSPRHGGQLSFDMGSTAIVETTGGNTIMLMSQRVPPFSLQQLLSCGIIPTSYELIVAKGVNAPIAAYSEVCKSIVKVDTPGVTQADMTRFCYQHRRKPLYPFEDITKQVTND